MEEEAMSFTISKQRKSQITGSLQVLSGMDAGGCQFESPVVQFRGFSILAAIHIFCNRFPIL